MRGDAVFAKGVQHMFDADTDEAVGGVRFGVPDVVAVVIEDDSSASVSELFSGGFLVGAEEDGCVCGCRRQAQRALPDELPSGGSHGRVSFARRCAPLSSANRTNDTDDSDSGQDISGNPRKGSAANQGAWARVSALHLSRKGR